MFFVYKFRREKRKNEYMIDLLNSMELTYERFEIYKTY